MRVFVDDEPAHNGYNNHHGTLQGRILECFVNLLETYSSQTKRKKNQGFTSNMVSSSWSVRVLTQSVMIAQVQSQSVFVPSSPPAGASAPIPEAFVSLSVEFGSFPTYAGNKTAPNQLTGNLLDNIAKYQGTRPYIRVGGTTQ